MTINYQLWKLWTTNYELQTTNYELLTSNYYILFGGLEHEFYFPIQLGIS